MPDVQIGLGAVIRDEHLTVLEGVHRARIHVQVGIELLHRHPEPAGSEQLPETRRGEALAKRGCDTPGDKYVFRRPCLQGGSPWRNHQSVCLAVTAGTIRSGASRLPFHGVSR